MEANDKRITTIKTTRLPLLRKRDNDIKQDKFAEKHSISTALVSKIECGEKGLSLDLAIRLSDYYNVSLDWLFDRSDDTNDKATNIIMDLRKIFKITFSGKHYINENGTAITEYPTLSIDEHLEDFIKGVQQAEKLRDNGDIPENVYALWIEDLKQKYNNLLSNEDTVKAHDYILVADNKVANLILEADCNQVLEEVVNTMGRKKFIDELKYL